jgi:hypothetical protein
MNAKAFVRLANHANPGVLGVHLVHNLVLLQLHLSGKKQWKLKHLQNLCDCKLVCGLQLFFDLGELFCSLILLKLRLAFLGLEEQFYLLPNFNNNLKCLSDILGGPFLLKETLDGNDVNTVFLVVPLTEGGYLEVSPIR